MEVELKVLIGKLNTICRQSLEGAAGLCVAQTHYNVEIEHFLLKVIENSDSDILRIFRYYDVPAATVAKELTSAIEKFKRGNSRTPTISPQLVSLFKDAWTTSTLLLNTGAVRSGAIFMTILDSDILRRLLYDSVPSVKKISRDQLSQDIVGLLQGAPEDTASASSGVVSADPTNTGTAPVPGSKTPSLDQYTIDMTAQAKAGKIDPIQGRDTEIRQIVDILMRRRQNNPILTGEAGVGKTAVVEGFALRIASGDVPPPLRGIRLLSLDLGLLQAGAGIKGEFENRLKSVINEVKNSTTPIILFIDEAHTLIGAGGAEGQNDAANLLKPALARGELRTIAATTWAEYKKYFEKDPALTRRFQVVKVEEPSEAKAIAMVRGLTAALEKHHHVRILDEAVQDAVKLSNRFIAGRQLPDKAISVIDTACARVAIAQTTIPPALEDITRSLQVLEKEHQALTKEELTLIDHKERLAAIQQEIEQLKARYTEIDAQWTVEKDYAQQISELYTQLQQLQQSPTPENLKEGERLTRELDRLRQELFSKRGEEPLVPIEVDSSAIASVIAGWTGIPVGKMQTDEIRGVLTLAEKMHERLIGQVPAINLIAQRVQTSRAELTDPEKPIGVFLLVGPSGVGKTETALTIADLLYGGEKNVITINMSEYQEAHTVSSLKGAPPGYVGYGKGGVLTEAVRRNPYSVVLLDECEKAHPDVMEIFYQVFDKGSMEDGEGVHINFRNTIILLTSNLATDVIADMCADEERPEPKELIEAIHPMLVEHFKPALLGRMTVIPYYPLSKDEVKRIAQLKLRKIQRRIAEHHKATLTYDDALLDFVAERSANADSGARAVDTIISNALLPELSGEILRRMAEAERFERIYLTVKNGEEIRFYFDNENDIETRQIVV